MFDNIGGKIKTWATVVCWIGIIASIIIGIWVITTATVQVSYYGSVTNWATVWTGVGIIIFGALGSWVSSFVLYGFGQLIEKTDENNSLLRTIASTGVGNGEPSAAPASPNFTMSLNQWKCKKCGAHNPTSRMSCKDCGEYR